VVVAGGKLAVKYGPQARIAWENGGKQAIEAARKRAGSLTARRKAMAQASTIVDGSVLKIAPEGNTAYVVFSGDEPVATHPPQQQPYVVLLAHVDLTRRVRPEPKPGRSGVKGRPGRPDRG
jgi:hypothetical protein